MYKLCKNCGKITELETERCDNCGGREFEGIDLYPQWVRDWEEDVF